MFTAERDTTPSSKTRCVDNRPAVYTWYPSSTYHCKTSPGLERFCVGYRVDLSLWACEFNLDGAQARFCSLNKVYPEKYRWDDSLLHFGRISSNVPSPLYKSCRHMIPPVADPMTFWNVFGRPVLTGLSYQDEIDDLPLVQQLWSRCPLSDLCVTVLIRSAVGWVLRTLVLIVCGFRFGFFFSGNHEIAANVIGLFLGG